VSTARRAAVQPAGGQVEPDTVRLRRHAVATLLANWRGSSTVPTAALYPHQWSWDSAFVSVGWAHVSTRRAWQELRSLFGGQWRDGRLPHIVYNRSVPEDAYFPGPPFWRPLPPDGPSGGPTPGVATSGLVQPPVHALAALAIADRCPGGAAPDDVRHLYPRLAAYHDYLFECRVVRHGLIATVHPWETGRDNSPAWDDALAAVPADTDGVAAMRRDLRHSGRAHRPTDVDYARYVHIAATYRDRGYLDESLGSLPFCVVDPMFNALLVASELALAEVADRLEMTAHRHRERAHALSAAMQQHLFDSALGLFVSVDARRWRPRRVRTVGGLVPLLLPDLDGGQRRALLSTLVGPAFRVGSAIGRGVPSYDLTAPDLDVHRYWRGPSWVSTSWLVWRGLRQCGETELAALLSRSVVDLVARAGFREYFHPSTGEGLGARDFSWSAALVLDLLRARSAEEEARPR
jgi:hypothetical protein